MINSSVKIITTKETYPLRLEVLWQHKNSLAECKLDIDDLTTTFHVGAYKNGEIICDRHFFTTKKRKI